MTVRTTFRVRVAVAAIGLSLTLGCAPDLGACDDALARTPYFDPNGMPMYAGQALVHASCGQGELCHARGARGGYRYGAPGHLDFDMRLDTGRTVEQPAELLRLLAGQRDVYDVRETLYERVVDRSMPPGGEAGRAARDEAPAFTDVSGRALPDVADPAAQELLRNWLACGAPVVERTAPLASGASRVGDVVACRDGSTDSCLCPEPTFTSIYALLLGPQCGSVCHTPDAPTQLAQNMLDLSTPALAYANLVGRAAQGTSCSGADRVRVRPGDPGGSLLVQKLENCDPSRTRPGATGPGVCDVEHGVVTGGIVCGDIMPLGGPASGLSYPCLIQPVREWIARGAPMD